MKVFKMDDYLCMAAETIGQAIDCYLDITGCEYEDLEVKEVDPDDTYMWWIIFDDLTDEEEAKFNQYDEFTLNGIQYGYWYGEKAKRITYTEAHKLYNEKMPYQIATSII